MECRRAVATLRCDFYDQSRFIEFQTPHRSRSLHLLHGLPHPLPGPHPLQEAVSDYDFPITILATDDTVQGIKNNGWHSYIRQLFIRVKKSLHIVLINQINSGIGTWHRPWTGALHRQIRSPRLSHGAPGAPPEISSHFAGSLKAKIFRHHSSKGVSGPFSCNIQHKGANWRRRIQGLQIKPESLGRLPADEM